MVLLLWVAIQETAVLAIALAVVSLLCGFCQCAAACHCRSGSPVDCRQNKSLFCVGGKDDSSFSTGAFMYISALAQCVTVPLSLCLREAFLPKRHHCSFSVTQFAIHGHTVRKIINCCCCCVGVFVVVATIAALAFIIAAAVAARYCVWQIIVCYQLCCWSGQFNSGYRCCACCCHCKNCWNCIHFQLQENDFQRSQGSNNSRHHSCPAICRWCCDGSQGHHCSCQICYHHSSATTSLHCHLCHCHRCRRCQC